MRLPFTKKPIKSILAISSGIKNRIIINGMVELFYGHSQIYVVLLYKYIAVFLYTYQPFMAFAN
jgi:hypothetical protein